MIDHFLSLFIDSPSDEARLEVLKGFFILLSALLTVTVTILIFLWRRERRQNDILRSLYIEVHEGWRALKKQTVQKELDYATSVQNPFAVADRTNFIFDGIKNDVSVLPSSVLTSIVEYYKLEERTNLLTDQLTSPVFLNLQSERQKRYTEILLEMLKKQKDAAFKALLDMKTELRHRGQWWGHIEELGAEVDREFRANRSNRWSDKKRTHCEAFR